MSWDQRFFDPEGWRAGVARGPDPHHVSSPLRVARNVRPKGKPLVTLRDAGNYVASLPEHEQRQPHWQTATELLLMVGNRGGDPMMVRIAMMQALHHGRANPAATAGFRRKAASPTSSSASCRTAIVATPRDQ
jgi:hypothetical protein